MAVSRQPPRPVMRRAAGLHAKRARGYRRRPLSKAVKAELLVEQHAPLYIGSAYHNNGLRKVCTDGGNWVHELSPWVNGPDRDPPNLGRGRQLPSIRVVPNPGNRLVLNRGNPAPKRAPR